MNLTIKRRTFNDKCFPYHRSPIPIQIFFGGASSGKSTFIARRAVMDALRDDRNYLVCRNVKNTIRGSCFAEVERAIDFYKVRNYFTINYSNLVITSKTNNRQIVFVGLDDPEKAKSIVPRVGVFTDLWVEEATEATEPAYNQMTLRLRGWSRAPKRITLSFNPIDKRHWINKRFLEPVGYDPETIRDYVSDDLLIVHSTYKDNAFLSNEDRARIEALKSLASPYFYNVYALGLWGVLGNLILTNWKILDLSEYKTSLDVYRNGLDFGFSDAPCACIRAGLKGNTIFVLDEFYNKELTADRLAQAIRPIVGRELVWADCEDPRMIKDLTRMPDTYRIRARPVTKGKDSVLHGLDWLMRHTILIDKSCQNFINEIQSYHWQQDKNGNPLDVPVKKNDHGIDALRYAFDRDMVGHRPLLVTTNHTVDGGELREAPRRRRGVLV